jgi:hypothetical protein
MDFHPAKVGEIQITLVEKAGKIFCEKINNAMNKSVFLFRYSTKYKKT